MAVPRPDTEEVKAILEDETRQHWTTKVDEPDKLSFVTEIFKLEIVWSGDYWTFKLYDVALPHDEPRWAQGPMYNATEIKNELPGFIPNEVRA